MTLSIKSSSKIKFLWRITYILSALTGVLLISDLLMVHYDKLFLKLIFTGIALIIGVILLAAQANALPKRSKMVAFGALVIFLSQICFFLLVWSDWKQYPLLWRFWWISMVPSVFITQILWLRSAAIGHRGRIEIFTAVCVLITGLMTLSLGFRRDIFGPLHPIYVGMVIFPALGMITGTMFVAFRQLLRRVGAEKLSKRSLAFGMVMSHLFLLLLGFYVGQGSRSQAEQSPSEFVTKLPEGVEKKFLDDIYKGQSKIATWLGDTKLVDHTPYISEKQLAILPGKLKPGDILLERRNWYLSNPWLPGFWPHAALYIGSKKDLAHLGLSDHPLVKKNRVILDRQNGSGEVFWVIEAVSDGVLLNQFTVSAHADYLAVLRPRLSDNQKSEAILRAFSHLNKPYDFNFDFEDRTKLVCTQVIYLSFEGMLDFQLRRIMGRTTLPANEIAIKFVSDRKIKSQQMEFILFLDTKPGEHLARFSNVNEFCKSVTRPRAFID